MAQLLVRYAKRSPLEVAGKIHRLTKVLNMPSVSSPLEQTLHDLIMLHLVKLDEYVPGPIKRAGSKKENLLRVLEQDPVYSIFGLDSPEYLTATLAGGTITSIHRKLGDIYQSCAAANFMHTLGQTADHLRYTARIVVDNKVEDRSIDIYLLFERLEETSRRRVEAYCATELGRLTATPQIALKAVGMEIRHCYQTGDSKRTQADEAMARHLLVSGILPVVPLFCKQSNRTVVSRYRSVWIVKEGAESYDLVEALSGFDFYDFLKRNRNDFREPILKTLRGLTK